MGYGISSGELGGWPVGPGGAAIAIYPGDMCGHVLVKKKGGSRRTCPSSSSTNNDVICLYPLFLSFWPIVLRTFSICHRRELYAEAIAFPAFPAFPAAATSIFWPAVFVVCRPFRTIHGLSCYFSLSAIYFGQVAAIGPAALNLLCQLLAVLPPCSSFLPSFFLVSSRFFLLYRNCPAIVQWQIKEKLKASKMKMVGGGTWENGREKIVINFKFEKLLSSLAPGHGIEIE